MKKSIIQQLGESLFEDYQKARKLNDSDVDNEIKRAQIDAMRAKPISDLAEIQARTYLNAGFLPFDNLIVGEDEMKLMAPASRRKRLNEKNNLLD